MIVVERPAILPIDRPAILPIDRPAILPIDRPAIPAALNFGDIFAYALAKTRNLPLLFKGNDFSETDIPSVIPRQPAH